MILDNASFHKRTAPREWVKAWGATRLFLLSYSPAVNRLSRMLRPWGVYGNTILKPLLMLL